MAAKKEKQEVQISDVDIERRSRLLVAYSEYARWSLSFPKRRKLTFTGATVLPNEAMLNVGLAYSYNPVSKERAFGLCFTSSEYNFLTEIGVYTAYWEENGVTVILNSHIMNLTSIPFIRLHFNIVNMNQLKQMQKYSKMFLLEIAPNGRVGSHSGFKPTRIYPEVIEVKDSYNDYSHSGNKIINRLLG